MLDEYVNLLYSMNDQTNVKDDKHMMIVPKYFKVRSPTENKRHWEFTHVAYERSTTLSELNRKQFSNLDLTVISTERQEK